VPCWRVAGRDEGTPDTTPQAHQAHQPKAQSLNPIRGEGPRVPRAGHLRRRAAPCSERAEIRFRRRTRERLDSAARRPKTRHLEPHPDATVSLVLRFEPPSARAVSAP
jgi:hypothetical protein